MCFEIGKRYTDINMFFKTIKNTLCFSIELIKFFIDKFITMWNTEEYED